MDIRLTESTGVQDNIDQVVGLKKQGMKEHVSASLQKKGAAIELNVNKNLMENKTASNKGSKLNVFA